MKKEFAILVDDMIEVDNKIYGKMLAATVDDIVEVYYPPETETHHSPIYLAKRKGFDSWFSCDKERYDKLFSNNLFETKIAYEK